MRFRIDFKILLLVFKCLCGLGPAHRVSEQNPTVWPFDIMVHVSGTACRNRAVETRLIFLVYLLNNIE